MYIYGVKAILLVLTLTASFQVSALSAAADDGRTEAGVTTPVRPYDDVDDSDAATTDQAFPAHQGSDRSWTEVKDETSAVARFDSLFLHDTSGKP